MRRIGPKIGPLIVSLFALSLFACRGDMDGSLDLRRSNEATENNETTPVTPVEAEPDPIFMPPEGPKAGLSPMRLLTRKEYDATVKDLLGVSMTNSDTFPPENVTEGFENNAWVHKVSPALLRSFRDESESISAAAAAAPPQELTPCAGADAEASACKQAISPFLTRAFRRPATTEEVEVMQRLYDVAREAEGAEVAFEMVIQATLMSPQFLYRIELYEPTPEGIVIDRAPVDGGMQASEVEPVGPYEMASRLSYFLWGTMPDQVLLDAAAAGDLNTREKLSEQVARMIADERFTSMIKSFHRQWLGISSFDSLTRDPAAFPMWDAEIARDWRLSIEAFIEYVYFEDGKLDALHNSSSVFLTPRLAELYGVDEPADHGGLWRHEFPATERRGLMTQPAIMALLSYPNMGSPINRAIFIRERLLCEHVPAPPMDPDVEIVAPDPDPSLTTREVFAVHTEQASCAGCHMLIDPLGFGFEGYDALGRYRTMENGKPVDESGELIGLLGEPELNQTFNGGAEFSGILSGSQAMEKCMVEKWFKFAMGRFSDDSDKPSIDRVLAAFRADERKFGTMFREMVLSDSFRFRIKRDVADARAREQFEMMAEGGMD